SHGRSEGSRTGGLRPPLAENFPVRLLVEADDERLADAGRRGPQVPRRSHQEAEQRRVVGPLLLQVEDGDLLAPRRDQFLDAVEQRERRLLVEPHLVRVHRLGHRHALVPKEPLGLLARRSGPPVVKPVDVLVHGTPPIESPGTAVPGLSVYRSGNRLPRDAASVLMLMSAARPTRPSRPGFSQCFAGSLSSGHSLRRCPPRPRTWITSA